MDIEHSEHFPEICLYRDIDLGGTFTPVEVWNGYVFMTINEVISEDYPNRRYNAVCLNNGSLYSFKEDAKVVAVVGTFSVDKYSSNSEL